MTKYLVILVTVLSFLMLAGCPQEQDLTPDPPLASLSNPADWTNPPEDDFTEFRGAFLKTFDMENDVTIEDRGLAPVLMGRQVSSNRATIPVWNSSLSFTDGSIADYPEPGFTTDYTVAPAGTNIYRIVSTTTYPAANDVVDSYIEEYFVKDEAPTGSWGTEDPIVDAAGTPDPTYRERMEVHFDDGSVQNEQIVKILGPSTGESGFAPLDITASLYYPDFAYPESDTDAVYSSVVIYSQDVSTNHNYWFWEGSAESGLLGVRFYTEHYVEDGAYYKGTTAAYERAIETFTTLAEDLPSQMEDIFVGSEHTTLAESVLRKEVVFQVSGGTPTSTAVGANTVMRTHVVDTAGIADADFLLQLLNDDAAVFADWDGAPYHIPSGTTADEIESVIPENEVVVKFYETNPDGSDLPLLLSDSEWANSDLAVLYRSINTGALDNTPVDPEDDITDDILPNGGVDQTLLMADVGVAEFDSDQGYKVLLDQNDASINPTSAGTVEAWVWVDKHADTAGIVHKGIMHNFSDEGYTLQFWGKRGNLAFGIVQQDNYRYRLVTSGLRLNTGKWYFLAGTWDENYVKLHIYYDQGVTTKHKVYSKTNTLSPPEPYTPSGPLVIGSQYLEGYGKAGFYGFDGKINGVVVSLYAKDETTLETYYNVNKDKTANW